MFIGVCVEFVAAVAWLAELFPDPGSANECSATRKRHSFVVCWCLMQQSGFLMGRTSRYFIARIADSSAINRPHAAWRYTLISRLDPRDSAHPYPAVPAGIADLAKKETSRHA